MADIPIKGSDNNTYSVDTDNLSGVETQVVKMRTGSEGVDEGLVSTANPMPTMDETIAWVLRRLLKVLGGFSFDTTSQLRSSVSGSVTISSGTVTTVTTCGTVTTGNMGIGDMGKPATSIMYTRQSFACGVGRNLIRS